MAQFERFHLPLFQSTSRTLSEQKHMMLRIVCATLSLLIIRGLAPSARAQEKLSEQDIIDIQCGTPSNLEVLFKAVGLGKKFALNYTHCNPWYLWGDFDGDGKPDYAVQLDSLNGNASETVILFGNHRVFWLSRQKLNYPGGAWYVYPKQKVPRSHWEEKRPPVLKGDGIMMVKPESSAAILYWTGKRFDSYFVSD